MNGMDQIIMYFFSIVIGDGVQIGAGAIILPGVTVGKYAGAGIIQVETNAGIALAACNAFFHEASKEKVAGFGYRQLFLETCICIR